MVSTRNGSAQPRRIVNIAHGRKRRREASRETSPRGKLPRSAAPYSSATNFLDGLTDDLIICILCKLSSSASCPADLVRIRQTCKRFNELGRNPLVLSNASTGSLAIRARDWCDEAHKFLKQCMDAGNLEATYILGMIAFYCLGLPLYGAFMMVKAAMKWHPAALYSLAIMSFNGGCNPRTGVKLLRRAATLGHLDALHELGYSHMDGYGDPARGCELVLCALSTPLTEPHPVNRFLVEWFTTRPVGPEQRLCSNGRCGRVETRKNEFRIRCGCCGKVQYCSRACRGVHSKLHKMAGNALRN